MGRSSIGRTSAARGHRAGGGGLAARQRRARRGAAGEPPLAAVPWSRPARASRRRRASPTSGRPPATSCGRPPIPGRGHSSPVVWGDRIFLTTAIEGEVVPGAKGVDAHHRRPGVPSIPQGVGDDRRQTFKVLALDARDGRVALGEAPPTRACPTTRATRRAASRRRRRSPTASWSVTYFGSEGLLFAYDMDGQPEVEGGPGRDRDRGRRASARRPSSTRTCSSCSATRTTATSRSSPPSTSAPASEVWRVAAQGAGELGDADARARRRARRAGHQRDGVDHRVRAGHGRGAVAGEGPGEQRRALAGGRRATWWSLSAGYPTKLAMAIRAGGSGDVTGTPRVLWKYTRARRTCRRRSPTTATCTSSPTRAS